MKKEIKNVIMIVLAAVIMSFNISNFARIGGLLPGGFTGISLLLQKILGEYAHITLPYSVLYIPLNLIPATISFFYIGKKFTVKSIIMIVLASVLTDFIPCYHLTNDILLCALFGGILNGVAIGLCLMADATSGGTDFISIFISKHYGRDAWNYIFFANVAVLAISGLLFGLEGAMYSIILQFMSTFVIQLMYKKYQKHTLCIITDLPEEVYHEIVTISNHDSTLFRGKGMYMGKERNMVYSVVSSNEVMKIVHSVKKADPHAFINILKSTQVEGNFYQKPVD